jgi:hypothetical protein
MQHVFLLRFWHSCVFLLRYLLFCVFLSLCTPPFFFPSFFSCHFLVLQSLARLHKLQQLNLQGNQLSGELPVTLTHLTALTELNLSKNRFSGPVPTAWGGGWHLNLGVLNLSHNRLDGNRRQPLAEMKSMRDMERERERETESGGAKNQAMEREQEAHRNNLLSLVPHMNSSTQYYFFSKQRTLRFLPPYTLLPY